MPPSFTRSDIQTSFKVSRRTKIHKILDEKHNFIPYDQRHLKIGTSASSLVVGQVAVELLGFTPSFGTISNPFKPPENHHLFTKG